MDIGTATGIIAVSAGLWLISLFAPVASLDGGKPQPGYGLLLFGWLGPLMFQFGWYANPLLWVGWSMLASSGGSGSGAGLVGVGLLVTGANAALWDEIPTGNGSQKVTKVFFGYYLWLATVIGTGLTLVVLGFASPDQAAGSLPLRG